MKKGRCLLMRSGSIVFIVLSAIAMGCLLGCNSNNVYESYYSPDMKTGWHADSVAEFVVPINDLQQKYNLFVQVRNNNDYGNSNLWVFIKTTSPSGKVANDTIECLMANQKGEWLGRGWGSLYFIHFPFQQQVRFGEKGNYTFDIRHGMRADYIKGIHDIGLRVEAVK